MLFVGFVAGIIACGSSASSDTLVPITGIVVRAETLTTGRGCGIAPTQVFKYVAVVFGVNPADANKAGVDQRHDEFVAANVYDCFTDGLFVDLPVSGGSTTYEVQVFAYNKAAYDIARGDPARGDELKGIATRLQVNRSALVNDGGPADRIAIMQDLERLKATNPTYTTKCNALEIQSVQSLAICDPLAVGGEGLGVKAAPATITLSAASFTTAKGTVVRCNEDYTTVKYRSGPSGVFGAATDAPCTSAITISPAAAPASWVIEVALIRSDMMVLGQTTCGAETSPGLTSPAVCKPIP